MIHSTRNLRADRVLVRFYIVRLEGERAQARKVLRKRAPIDPSFSLALYFSSSVAAYLFFSVALTRLRRFYRNLNRPRPVWQKGSYFTISHAVGYRPKDIVNIIHGAPTLRRRTVYIGRRLHPGTRAGERSRFMAGPCIRGTLNLLRLTLRDLVSQRCRSL